jgi:hypothetical protein
MDEMAEMMKYFSGKQVRVFREAAFRDQVCRRMLIEHRPGTSENYFICDRNGTRTAWKGRMVMQLTAGSSPASEVLSTSGFRLDPVSADEEKLILDLFDEVLRNPG